MVEVPPPIAPTTLGRDLKGQSPLTKKPHHVKAYKNRYTRRGNGINTPAPNLRLGDATADVKYSLMNADRACYTLYNASEERKNKTTMITT